MSSKNYQTELMQCYKDGSWQGEMQDATIVKESTNASCQDKIKIFLKVENNIVKNASFTGQGCLLSQGAAAYLLKNLEKKNISDFLSNFTEQSFLEKFELSPQAARANCLLLPLQILCEIQKKL